MTLSDALFAKAKRQAERESTTLSDLIEAALRDYLLRPSASEPMVPFRLVTFGQGGLHPGLSFERLDQLEDDENAARLASRAAESDDPPTRR